MRIGETAGHLQVAFVILQGLRITAEGGTRDPQPGVHTCGAPLVAELRPQFQAAVQVGERLGVPAEAFQHAAAEIQRVGLARLVADRAHQRQRLHQVVERLLPPARAAVPGGEIVVHDRGGPLVAEALRAAQPDLVGEPQRVVVTLMHSEQVSP